MRSGLYLLMALLPGCFGGPGFMGQKKHAGAGSDARNIKVNVENQVLSATVSASAGYTQVITAPEASVLKGVSASFAPGSLVIDTTIIVEEAAPFANDRLLAELGISNTFTAASVAVAVQPTVKGNPTQPFQIALPLPGLSGLNLGGNENVVVAYRYEDAASGKILSGIMPNSDLRFSGGSVNFFAKFFGVFQVTVTDQKILSAVQTEAAATILTKRDIEKLAPLQLLNRKPVVIQSGKTVEITGQNLRPTLFLAVNGKPTKVQVQSDAKAQFVMPEVARLGLTTVAAEQDGVVEKMSLVYTNPNDYPVITLAETEVCAGSKYYDLNGNLKTGTKNCGPAIAWPSTNGSPGQVLATDGSGNLSWMTPPSGGGGGGIGVGSITSMEIADGTITDADISATAAISFLKISGLGSAASKNVGASPSDVAPGTHTHNMQQIVEAGGCMANQVLAYSGTSWACMPLPMTMPPSVSMPPQNHTIYEESGSLLVANTDDSMWQLPTSAPATSGYRITVKNNSNGYLKIYGSTLIDGSSSAFYLYERGDATFTYSGSEWFVTNVRGEAGRVVLETCGGAADECYNDAAAMATGFARTPTNKRIELKQNGVGFFVWKEKAGDRFLEANGTDNWSMQLNANGKGVTAQPMKVWQQVAGRACPIAAYLDDSNKMVSGKCLYYADMGSQMLSAAGISQTLPNMGMNSWASPLWYVGNVRTCGEKGMRLPTVFETNTTQTSSAFYPASDGAPTFATSSGIPAPSTSMWTATSATSSTDFVAVLPDQNVQSAMATSMTHAVRCVFF